MRGRLAAVGIAAFVLMGASVPSLSQQDRAARALADKADPAVAAAVRDWAKKASRADRARFYAGQSAIPLIPPQSLVERTIIAPDPGRPICQPKLCKIKLVCPPATSPTDGPRPLDGACRYVKDCEESVSCD